MTYNVFSGTLNPAQSIDQLYSNNTDILLNPLIQFYLNNVTNLPQYVVFPHNRDCIVTTDYSDVT